MGDINCNPFFYLRGDKAKSMIAKVLRVFYLFTSGVTKIFYKNKNEKNNFFFYLGVKG